MEIITQGKKNSTSVGLERTPITQKDPQGLFNSTLRKKNQPKHSKIRGGILPSYIWSGRGNGSEKGTRTRKRVERETENAHDVGVRGGKMREEFIVVGGDIQQIKREGSPWDMETWCP